MPFQMIYGDITCQKVDAIVNAANSSLLGGGGVDGAIHLAAGPGLLEECKALGGCRTGEARITGGYNLPAKFVIHTVGPIWRGGRAREEELLRACYQNSLQLAVKYGVKSIAFPLISAGAYGYPLEQARETAVSQIRSFLDHTEDLDVSLVLYDRSSLYQGDPDLARYLEERENRRKAFYREAAREYSVGAPAEELFTQADSVNQPLADEAPLFSATPAPKAVKKPGIRESLESFLKKKDKGFNQYLLDMIDEKHMTDPECYKRANVSRKTFSKIRNGEMKPGKEMVLAFCIALKLSVPEAQMLLGKAGYTLTNSSLGDLIVQYFLEKREYDIDKVNYELLRYDQKLLGSSMN